MRNGGCGRPLNSVVMHLRSSVAALIVVACAGLSGCDEQIPQLVTGSLSLKEGPVANRALRLYASHPNCEGTFAEARTDANGRFNFRTESTRGGVSVVVQPMALCVEHSGRWTPLWATLIGGGANRITLMCRPHDTNDPFDQFCVVDAQYG
jgi:hypothetical protein